MFKDGKSSDALVVLQPGFPVEACLASGQQSRELCLMHVCQSSFNNDFDSYISALTDKPTCGEKLDFAHSKFLGHWNSANGRMEWTVVGGGFSNFLGDSSFSKRSGPSLVIGDVSRNEVKDNQNPKTVVP